MCIVPDVWLSVILWEDQITGNKAEEDDRSSLKYKLLGAGGDISLWGHEYVRHLAGEIIYAYRDQQVFFKLCVWVCCD